jgi:nucleoside-diphosphate-sugar epimerase
VRIFLTGATGFVGSEVLRQLLRAGHETAALLREESNTWRIDDLLDQGQWIRTADPSLRDVRDALVDFKPEAFLHLAWDGVASSDRNDEKQLANVALTSATLELAREAGAKHWIGLGSQAEYGPANARITEATPTRPTTQYGIAKLSSSMIAKRFCERAGMRFVWLRLFSAYGPADNPEWLIPYLILTLLRGEQPRLTAGRQRWDYLYVKDAARAIVLLTERAHAAGIFNLGSGRTVEIRALVETIWDAVDPSLPLRFGEVPYRSDQVMHLEADVTSLTKAAGWQPTTSLADGLMETVRYYRENHSRFDR